jgi:hypothetical protein
MTTNNEGEMVMSHSHWGRKTLEIAFNAAFATRSTSSMLLVIGKIFLWMGRSFSASLPITAFFLLDDQSMM